MRRGNIESFLHKKYQIPVIFITQAIGLSLGLTEKQLGLQRHLVSTSSLLNIVAEVPAAKVQPKPAQKEVE